MLVAEIGNAFPLRRPGHHAGVPQKPCSLYRLVAEGAELQTSNLLPLLPTHKERRTKFRDATLPYPGQ
jgi:hypothetical protein